MPGNERRSGQVARRAAGLLVVLLAAASGSAARSETVKVAAAANFTAAAREIASAFTAATGHEIVLSFGSSGQIYAQITQAAPFDVFLSADQARPAQLIVDGLAIAESRFTYAVGRLVLWSADPGLVADEATLRAGHFEKLAIADPATAPYGAAALETIAALGLSDALRPTLVTGASISQAFQFVETGNAELGFVAGSQLVGVDGGSRWAVPPDLHVPIRQDAVLLMSARGNEAAAAFLAFLKGPDARAIIMSHGYDPGEGEP